MSCPLGRLKRCKQRLCKCGDTIRHSNLASISIKCSMETSPCQEICSRMTNSTAIQCLCFLLRCEIVQIFQRAVGSLKQRILETRTACDCHNTVFFQGERGVHRRVSRNPLGTSTSSTWAWYGWSQRSAGLPSTCTTPDIVRQPRRRRSLTHGHNLVSRINHEHAKPRLRNMK